MSSRAKVYVSIGSLIGLLLLLSAFALLEGVASGIGYSAVVGLPSRVRDAELMRHRADMFAYAALAIDGLAAAALASVLPLPLIDRRPLLTILARYGVAIMISMLSTGAILVLLWAALIFGVI
jgi:hypothetical protein